MKRLLIALSAVMLVTVACQKEASFEDPSSTPGTGGGGNNPTGRLTRMVLVGGADSLAYNMTYDGAGRLSLMTIVATNYLESIRYERNAAGIITNIILKNPGLLLGGIDSIKTRYNYNAAQARYTAGIFEATVQNGVYIDSTAFVYDNGGKLISRVSFSGGVGVPFEPNSKLDFTHAGPNLNSVSSFTHDGTGWDADYTISYAYDSKVNPLQLGIESLLIDPYLSPAFGLNSSIYFGPNNATLVDYVDPSDAAENYKITTTFTYNTQNKPAGGTSVETPGNSNTAWRYYYN